MVEDEPGVRELVRKVLERGGYHVILAATPTEALEIVETITDPIDLLMTDVVLPEMSGRVLAVQMALRRPTLRVLYMSGYTDNAIVHHGVLDPVPRSCKNPSRRRCCCRRSGPCWPAGSYPQRGSLPITFNWRAGRTSIVAIDALGSFAAIATASFMSRASIK